MQKEPQEKDLIEMTPGQRLEVLLDHLRFTQTALADMTDVSPQYVNNIVRRGQSITETFAQRLSEATDVDLNWLFTGEGPMLRRAKTVEPLPEDYEDLVMVEDQLNNAATNLRSAAKRLLKARDSE